MMEIIGGVFGIRPAGDVVRHPFGDRLGFSDVEDCPSIEGQSSFGLFSD